VSAAPTVSYRLTWWRVVSYALAWSGCVIFFSAVTRGTVELARLGWRLGGYPFWWVSQ
jgi:hypothetical protein